MKNKPGFFLGFGRWPKIKSVSSWLECCARICRRLCVLFYFFTRVCVCIYIYIEFLSSFVFFFMMPAFWTASIWATRSVFRWPVISTGSSWTHRHRPLIIPASSLTFWPLCGCVALPLWKSISQKSNRRDRTLVCSWLGFESQKCDLLFFCCFFLWFFFSFHKITQTTVQPANWLTVRFHSPHSSTMWKCNHGLNSPHCFSTLPKIKVCEIQNVGLGWNHETSKLHF